MCIFTEKKTQQKKIHSRTCIFNEKKKQHKKDTLKEKKKSLLKKKKIFFFFTKRPNAIVLAPLLTGMEVTMLMSK